MLCRGWTSRALLDIRENVNVAALMVSCASMVVVTLLLEALHDVSLHHNVEV